jgi:hypothetical protein
VNIKPTIECAEMIPGKTDDRDVEDEVPIDTGGSGGGGDNAGTTTDTTNNGETGNNSSINIPTTKVPETKKKIDKKIVIGVAVACGIGALLLGVVAIKTLFGKKKRR